MVMAVGLEDVFSKEISNVSKYSVRIYLDFVFPPYSGEFYRKI